jgi:cobalt-zinc-cadmium efflux system protein
MAQASSATSVSAGQPDADAPTGDHRDDTRSPLKPRTRVHRLLVVLTVNVALVAALLTVGITAHSLAVFAEGGDYLLDAAGVCVALVAIRVTARRPGKAGQPGSQNATTIAALVNAGWLLVLEMIVAGAAIDRLVHQTPRVDGLSVLIVSTVAALAMTGGALILRSDGEGAEAGERDLSIAAVLLDTVADASAAAGVAAAGAVILGTGSWYWVDPAVALTVAAIFGYQALLLCKAAVANTSRGTGRFGQSRRAREQREVSQPADPASEQAAAPPQ